jgi:hypothetical protein
LNSISRWVQRGWQRQDSINHLETWLTLKAVAGWPDFFYVADAKLCSHGNLDAIHRAGGRFVAVLPRSQRRIDIFGSASRPRSSPGSWCGIDRTTALG